MLGLNLNTEMPFSPFSANILNECGPPEDEVDAVAGRGGGQSYYCFIIIIALLLLLRYYPLVIPWLFLFMCVSSNYDYF